jgi:glycosyltransferase involved in cell wall biosynthesis
MTVLNVLLVTYSFPPAGGVGVLRAASLARYLPAEGIQLDVLTTRNASAVGTDSSLLNEIPAGVNIHRTITLDLPFGVKKWIKERITGAKPPASRPATTTTPAKPNFLKRVLQDVLLPDPQVTWLPVLTGAARRIVRQRNIDLVLITVPPFSSLLLAERLRKDFPQLAIVVDFRDEWLSTTIDLVSFSRSDRAARVARDAEAAAVANATAVVAVTEAARREIRDRYPRELDNKFQLISNGFDATRTHASAPSTNSERAAKSSPLTSAPSMVPRTHNFGQAVQSLPAEVKSRLKLRFIGRIEDPRFRDILLQLGDMVELNGFLPQHEALAAMNEADYALLITHDPLNVSAKFYDYIGAGKPILATVHPGGEVRRLLEELHAGWWADSRDVEGIRKLFLDAAARGPSLLTAFQPDKEKIAQYERKVLAQRYASLLHSIVHPQDEAGSRAVASDSAGEVKQPC